MRVEAHDAVRAVDGRAEFLAVVRVAGDHQSARAAVLLVFRDHARRPRVNLILGDAEAVPVLDHRHRAAREDGEERAEAEQEPPRGAAHDAARGGIALAGEQRRTFRARHVESARRYGLARTARCYTTSKTVVFRCIFCESDTQTPRGSEGKHGLKLGFL